jgi:hypothetical protein
MFSQRLQMPIGLRVGFASITPAICLPWFTPAARLRSPALNCQHSADLFFSLFFILYSLFCHASHNQQPR